MNSSKSLFLFILCWCSLGFVHAQATIAIKNRNRDIAQKIGE